MGKGTDTVLLSLERRLKLLEERLDQMDQLPLPRIRRLLDEFEKEVKKYVAADKFRTSVFVDMKRQEIVHYVETIEDLVRKLS